MQTKPIIISPISATDGRLYAIVGTETNPSGILIPVDEVGDFVQNILTPAAK